MCSSGFPSVLATKPCAALRCENLLHGTQYFQDSWKMTVGGTVTSMEEYEGYVRQQTKTKNVMPVLKAGFTKLARRDPELSPAPVRFHILIKGLGSLRIWSRPLPLEVVEFQQS